MNRITKYSGGVAVIPKEKIKDAAAELAKYEDAKEKTNMTNADVIRQMGDEELAVTIMCPNETGHAKIECNRDDDCNCCKCCLEWLRSKSD